LTPHALIPQNIYRFDRDVTEQHFFLSLSCSFEFISLGVFIMRQSLMSKAATLAAGIAVSTAVSVALGSEAQAATITRTVNGVSYDISTRDGTFGSLRDTLTQQVWWGNPELANSFASVVGSSLGGPNFGVQGLGPFFAWNIDSNGGVPLFYYSPRSAGVEGLTSAQNGAATWATAVRTPTTGTAVPTPALLPALMGFGVSIWRKRKDERSPVEA
jgi:hypothetical protein